MCIATSECKRGVFECQNDIRTLRDDLPDAVCDELDAVWQKIRDLAIDLCPKESGALASSIEIESEGGSGSIGRSGGTQGEFYSNSIYAGNDETFNFEGQPTSQYAGLVHDGHAMRDGSWWEGCPFLEDAVDFYEEELNQIVNNAINSMEIGDYSNPSTYAKGVTTD
jgi:hypothetical protein